MEHWQLKQMQSLDLEVKILKTKQRIKEWYEHYDGKVYVSFSGGKDSTVLLHIARSIYPEITAVFVDTGLEYPEIRSFVSFVGNVSIIKPKKTFMEVINDYGYPVISKMQASTIKKLTTQNLSDRYRKKLLYGDEKGKASKLSDKWKFLLTAPFKISDACCDVMKKRPLIQYQKQTGNKPIIGTMACESYRRENQYLHNGCNAFELKKPVSTPIAFWTEQDVLLYIRNSNIPYCSVYGEIIKSNGLLTTSAEKRTGCMFCMFGVHMEKGENRFQRMARTHPKIHDYCINKLGIGVVLDYINVSY